MLERFSACRRCKNQPSMLKILRHDFQKMEKKSSGSRKSEYDCSKPTEPGCSDPLLSAQPCQLVSAEPPTVTGSPGAAPSKQLDRPRTDAGTTKGHSGLSPVRVAEMFRSVREDQPPGSGAVQSESPMPQPPGASAWPMPLARSRQPTGVSAKAANPAVSAARTVPLDSLTLAPFPVATPEQLLIPPSGQPHDREVVLDTPEPWSESRCTFSGTVRDTTGSRSSGAGLPCTTRQHATCATSPVPFKGFHPGTAAQLADASAPYQSTPDQWGGAQSRSGGAAGKGLAFDDLGGLHSPGMSKAQTSGPRRASSLKQVDSDSAPAADTPPSLQPSPRSAALHQRHSPGPPAQVAREGEAGMQSPARRTRRRVPRQMAVDAAFDVGAPPPSGSMPPAGQAATVRDSQPPAHLCTGRVAATADARQQSSRALPEPPGRLTVVGDAHGMPSAPADDCHGRCQAPLAASVSTTPAKAPLEGLSLVHGCAQLPVGPAVPVTEKRSASLQPTATSTPTATAASPVGRENRSPAAPCSDLRVNGSACPRQARVHSGNSESGDGGHPPFSPNDAALHRRLEAFVQPAVADVLRSKYVLSTVCLLPKGASLLIFTVVAV